METQIRCKCEDCGKEHDEVTESCADCQSTNLRRPNPAQKKYADSFLHSEYANDAEQMFIDVLKKN